MDSKHERAVKEAGENRKEHRKFRIKVFAETKKLCESAPLHLSLNPPAPISVNHFTELSIPDLTPRVTQIVVINGDCLEVALKYQALGLRPAVLNMASAHSVGGNVKGGAGAQEENLFRRTDYYRHLNKKLVNYPHSPTGGVYSPGVLVFRASEADRYSVLEAPKHLDFIAVAAIKRPNLLQESLLSPEHTELTRDKIRCILAFGASQRHDCLVLSAFGCGAYQNPPRHIAQLFREELESDTFRGKFSVVAFAIFDDSNAMREHNPEGNVVPFVQVFEVPLISDLSEIRL